VDAEKMKPSAFLLVGVRKGIQPVKLHVKTRCYKNQAGSLLVQVYLEKLLLKRCVCVCVY